MESDRVNLSPQYTGQKQTSDISRHTPQVEQDSRTPKTPSQPQPPTLILGTLGYRKREDQVYHTEKNEGCNIDECVE